MEIILILVAALLMSYRRILSGLKNGAFYGKGRSVFSARLNRAIGNLHTVETPAWYSQFGAMFLLLLAYKLDWTGALSAALITMGSSAMANYHYQGYINLGSGLPFENPNENPKSEFSNWFWWKRPWYGKIRKLVAIAGAISAITGLVILWITR